MTLQPWQDSPECDYCHQPNDSGTVVTGIPLAILYYTYHTLDGWIASTEAWTTKEDAWLCPSCISVLRNLAKRLDAGPRAC